MQRQKSLLWCKIVSHAVRIRELRGKNRLRYAVMHILDIWLSNTKFGLCAAKQKSFASSRGFLLVSISYPQIIVKSPCLFVKICYNTPINQKAFEIYATKLFVTQTCPKPTKFAAKAKRITTKNPSFSSETRAPFWICLLHLFDHTRFDAVSFLAYSLYFC